MEPVFQSHPVPQNVTNFEFHLVGDMTLKQFGYLAAGLGFAFLTFTTLATKQPIIAWPVIIISALLGVAFAFLPIQERPLDHWVKAFFHAIFRPTRLSYQSKILSKDDPFFKKRLNYYLETHIYHPTPALTISSTTPPIQTQSLPTSTNSTLPSPTLGKTKKPNYIERFKQQQEALKIQQPVAPVSPSSNVIKSTPLPPLPNAGTPVVASTPPIPQVKPAVTPSFPPLPSQPKPPETPPAVQDLQKTVELAKEAQETKEEILKIEKDIKSIKSTAAQPGVDPQKYVEQFEELLTELQKLNEKASITAKELAIISNLPDTQKKVEEIPVQAKVTPSIKLTSFANVINGVITDSQGNYVEGAIIVAHDTQGLPVRALKSNKLGQFVAATPLANGQYIIEAEKDNLAFEKVSVELKNEVLPSIVLTAKPTAPAVKTIQTSAPHQA